MKIGYESSSNQLVGTLRNNLISTIKSADSTIETIEFDYLEFYNNRKWHEKIRKKSMQFMLLTSGDSFWEWNIIPKLGSKMNIDIYHALSGCVPRKATFKTIQTVHDLAYHYYPEYLSPPTIRFFNSWYKWSAHAADMIWAISNSTKQDIIKYWGIPENKIFVVYQGVSDIFFNKNTLNEIEAVKLKYNTGDNYILFLGEINYRKNIHTIIEAFHQFIKKGGKLKLVLAGKLRGDPYENRIKSLIKKYGLEKSVVMTDKIPANDVFPLYQGASIFTFPSLYEGFGLPVLEAFASGVPVVTSNVSSMPEIAGDAALLVNPLDSMELCNALLKIYHDERLASELVEKGIAQSQKFSWKNTAENLISIYYSILK